jgi:hypothetical protein
MYVFRFAHRKMTLSLVCVSCFDRRSPKTEEGNEMARFHDVARRRGGGMAAGGARTAGGAD